MRGETAEQAVANHLVAPATQLAIDPPDPEPDAPNRILNVACTDKSALNYLKVRVDLDLAGYENIDVWSHE